MAMSTEQAGRWLSATDLAKYGKEAGLPGTARGCRLRAQREGWESMVIKGRGGPNGELTVYMPPPPVQAAISELSAAERAVPHVAERPANYGPAAASTSEAAHTGRREMLSALLLTMESQLRAPVPQDTAALMLQVVATWREFARHEPDLQARLNAIHAAARLYSSLAPESDRK